MRRHCAVTLKYSDGATQVIPIDPKAAHLVSLSLHVDHQVVFVQPFAEHGERLHTVCSQTGGVEEID